MLYPAYWMVSAALQNNDALTELRGWPAHIGFGAFSTAFHDQSSNLVTSLIVAVGAVIVCLVIATPAAYGLAQFRLPGGPLVIFGILVTQMIPNIVVANALYSLYSNLHLLNSYLGLILADASNGIPFAILIMRSFMTSIPPSIIEAARVDGANRFRAFTAIVIPVSRNAVVTASLFSFLFAWSDFVYALTLTTGTGKITPITLGLYQYIGAHNDQWSALMATAVLASIPAAVLLVSAQRFVAAGVTGGAVK
jgi:multiple sugar transport system permease protein